MKSVQIPGSYPDVTFHRGELYIASVHNDVQVHKFLPGVGFALTAAYPCGGNGFARLRSVDDQLWLFYRPNDGKHAILRNISTDKERIYRPDGDGGFYNWPLALGEHGYAVNSLGQWCRVYNYAGGLINQLPSLPGTGIACLSDENLPVSVDDNRGTMYDPWKIWNPEFSTGLTVGEDETSGIGAVYENRVKRIFLSGQYTFLPKVARDGVNPLWAMVTTDYANVTLLSDVTAADFESAPPTEPPTEPQPPRVITVKAGEEVVIRGIA